MSHQFDVGHYPMWVCAKPSAEVGASLVAAEAEGVRFLVGRLLGGDVVACAETCPHQGRPLEGGALYETYIVCPHHHYVYDARTGENRYPKSVFPRERAAALRDLVVFHAEEREGWVWVDLGTTQI